MKKLISILVIIVFSIVGPVTAQAPEPDGWQDFVKAITSTKFSNASTLDGKSFALEFPSASGKAGLQLTPANAFDIKSIGAGKFTVTITNSSALVDSSKPLLRYFPLGWTKVDGGDYVADIAIEGQASCTYTMRFSQTGGNDLNLSALDSGYVISWEADNPSQLSSIDRDGAGLAVRRKAGDTGKVAIKLSIKDKADGTVQSTTFIPIPACVDSKPSTEVVTADPKPDPKPDTEVAASSCFKNYTNSLTPCSDCGKLTVVRNITTTNQCNSRVRCEGMMHNTVSGGAVIGSQERWVDLYANGSTTYDVTIMADSSPSSFTVMGPVGGSCWYVK